MKHFLLNDAKEYPELIKKYHQLSEDYLINTKRTYVEACYKGKDLDTLYARNAVLMEVADPFLETLYDYVKNTGFFLELIDSDGIILTIIGDLEVVESSKNIGMDVGSDMSTQSVGTNAIGIAIEEDCAIQMRGQDHFMDIYKQYTCSAAALHDVDGHTVGCVNLNGLKENVHEHTLALVVAAVNAIENHIKINKKQKELIKAYRYMNTIINSIDTGILALDSDGKIILVNKDGCRMFRKSPEAMSDLSIFEFFKEDEKVSALIKKQIPIDDYEVRIKVTGQWVMLESRQIFDDEGNMSGVILLLRDVKKVMRLVDRYAGMSAKYTFDEILGKSDEIIRIKEYGKAISNSPSTVLIQGESGTGKELFAQSIHNASGRNQRPFVAINCGAIPKELIESELFGYVEGAFTGAKKGGYVGKFAIADKGTLFLDEIGEMPLHMQVNLLRALQEGEIMRIGANGTVKVDVRIIAATNKNLKKEVEDGRFREDLYYRLNVIPIYLPSLRERNSDVALLIAHYLKTKAALLGKATPILEEALYKELLQYRWPGNIRELENTIESIVNLGGKLIYPLEKEKSHTMKAITAEKKELILPDISLKALEYKAIFQCLEKNKHNYSQTAKELGINRTTLYNKMKKYAIESVE